MPSPASSQQDPPPCPSRSCKTLPQEKPRPPRPSLSANGRNLGPLRSLIWSALRAAGRWSSPLRPFRNKSSSATLLSPQSLTSLRVVGTVASIPMLKKRRKVVRMKTEIGLAAVALTRTSTLLPVQPSLKVAVQKPYPILLPPQPQLLQLHPSFLPIPFPLTRALLVYPILPFLPTPFLPPVPLPIPLLTQIQLHHPTLLLPHLPPVSLQLLLPQSIPLMVPLPTQFSKNPPRHTPSLITRQKTPLLFLAPPQLSLLTRMAYVK